MICEPSRKRRALRASSFHEALSVREQLLQLCFGLKPPPGHLQDLQFGFGRFNLSVDQLQPVMKGDRVSHSMSVADRR